MMSRNETRRKEIREQHDNLISIVHRHMFIWPSRKKNDMRGWYTSDGCVGNERCSDDGEIAGQALPLEELV